MAPNKPLLVLAILDLVEAGLVGMVCGANRNVAAGSLKIRLGQSYMLYPQRTLQP
jgi:hypothetical protein